MTTHIDTLRNSRRYATQCNKKEFRPLGSSGIFPFSLEDEARRWYTVASIEAKGNWDELVKKFLLKFFPISKVQDLRRQVLTFKEGEDEGIDEA
jgi:hypothetical protein